MKKAASKPSAFPRSERLRSTRTISRLFDRNSKDVHSFLVYPFRVVVLQNPEDKGYFPEVLISVPKRTFKKAVDRNRIKRLTREAYRNHKIVLSKETFIGFLFVGKQLPVMEDVMKSIQQILSRLNGKESPQ